MTRQGSDPEVKEALGDRLWGVLEAEDEALPEGFDAKMAARLAADDAREALGEDAWEALGNAEEPVLPEGFDAAFAEKLQGAEVVTLRPRTRWTAMAGAVGLAVAAAVALVLVLPSAQTLDDRLADDAREELDLVAALDLAENLDVASHPDLDLILAWDGSTP